MSLARRGAAAAVVVASLSACANPVAGGHAGHEAQGSTHDTVDGAPEATVTAVDNDFRPATLVLQASEPTNVTVTNRGKTLHDFTLEEADVHANVEPGAQVATAVTIDQPGSYKAICTVAGHAEAGMVIDVTVTQ